MAANMKITVLWDVTPSFQRNLRPPSFTLNMAELVPPKQFYLCMTLHSATSQKAGIFMVFALVCYFLVQNPNMKVTFYPIAIYIYFL